MQKTFGFIVTVFSVITLSAKEKSIAQSKVGNNGNIVDEFRNLEDLKDSAVISWMTEETKNSDDILNKIPNKNRYLEKRLELEKRTGFAASNLKITANDDFFYIKRNAGETAKVYFRKGFRGAEQLLYDPTHYQSPAQNVGDFSKHEFVINTISPSWDGRKIAVSLSEKGKEMSEIVVIDVESKKILPNVITQTNPSSIGGINWLSDNSGFFYVYYPETDGKSKSFTKNTKSILYSLSLNHL